MRSSLLPSAQSLTPTLAPADSCKALPGTVVLDSHGKRIVSEEGIYPFNGLALPQESLRLFRASFRTLSPVWSEAEVDGLAGQTTSSARSRTAGASTACSPTRPTTGERKTA